MTAAYQPQNQPAPPQGYAVQPRPHGPLGKIRGPVAVVLLSFITFGIYWLVYVYKTASSLKAHANVGLGGPVALLIAFFVGIATPFLLGNDVGRVRELAGQEPRVSALTAFWCLIPIAGLFIFAVKVQGALNDYWRSLGATG